MRVSLLTLALALVLAASALNLALGALWVAGVIGVLALRRRVRLGAWLVLLVVIGVGAAGVRFGWLTRPAPDSYATGEGDWLLARVRRPAPPSANGATVDAALRARLLAREREELRYSADDFERRAAAAVALSRSLAALRGRAPEPVSAVEGAVRRLAVTLTSPEFQDLDGRRARLQAWFDALEARLATARDETEVEAIACALDPAAMATVSLRALREDLDRVDAATAVLVQTLTEGGVSVVSASSLRYDEGRDVMITEVRYTVTAEPPLRIAGLDVGLLRRRGAGPGVTETLSYEAGDDTAKEVRGRDVTLRDGAARVIVVSRRESPAVARPVRPLLRWIAFTRVATPRDEDSSGEVWVTVALDGPAGAEPLPEPLIVVAVPAPPLEGIRTPRYSLFYVSRPGTVTTREAADEWIPATPGRPGALFLETAPATPLFRNPVFAGLKAYLYVPNPAAILAIAGLAALACVLMGRRRAAPPPRGG